MTGFVFHGENDTPYSLCNCFPRSTYHNLRGSSGRIRSNRAPAALRAAAWGWTRRWWGMVSVAVQQAVASTALQPPQATSVAGPPLDHIVDLAEAEGPSSLPLRHLS